MLYLHLISITSYNLFALTYRQNQCFSIYLFAYQLNYFRFYISTLAQTLT